MVLYNGRSVPIKPATLLHIHEKSRRYIINVLHKFMVTNKALTGEGMDAPLTHIKNPYQIHH